MIRLQLLFVKLSDVKDILGYDFHDDNVFFFFSVPLAKTAADKLRKKMLRVESEKSEMRLEISER